jgi:hypothetical protein
MKCYSGDKMKGIDGGGIYSGEKEKCNNFLIRKPERRRLLGSTVLS